MSEVVIIKIKKRTLWILSVAFLIFLVIFLALAATFLLIYLKEVERSKWIKSEDYKKRKEEARELFNEAKEFAMRQHIQHIDEGEKYHKYCGMCNGNW